MTKECFGSCEKHIGKVQYVNVKDPRTGYDWGEFYYCEHAIKGDTDDGLVVTILNDAEEHQDADVQYLTLTDEQIEEQLLRFSRAIRKETIEEVLTLLKDVPNPEANRTAINRIMSM